MIQIIREVLEDMADGQINLASEAARKTIANLISAALKTKGVYTEYGDEEIEEQEIREGWVCQSCGKSTFETDYDYLVNPKLHLGCALENEVKGEDIKNQYHKASTNYYKERVADNKIKNKIKKLLNEGK